MRWLAAIGSMVLAGALATGFGARAEDPLLMGLQAIQHEKRAAIEALRRGDLRRADMALRRMTFEWHREVSEIPLIRRRSEPGLEQALQRFDQSLAVTTALIGYGDAAGAEERLRALPAVLDEWRAARRVPLLADCLDAFTRTWEGLLDTSRPRDELARVALDAQAALDRCDMEASRLRRRDPTFQDLVQRLRSSFTGVHRAITRGDDPELAKALREQQILERAIALRYG